MNSLQKTCVPQNFEGSNLSFTEICITAIAMITALSLQAHSQNPQLPVNLKQNLSFLAISSTTGELIMFGKSVRPQSQSLNTPCKLSAVIALIAVGMMGVTTKISQTSLKSYANEELNLSKPGKVTISRYEMTDPTTGSAISVSQIQNR